MAVAWTEREADSIADVFPAPTEEFTNATWRILQPFAFGKLADATWYIQESAAALSLPTTYSEVSQTFAKTADVLMGMVPRVSAWDYALKTPLQEAGDVYSFERGEYYRHYGALLMNKLSLCKPLLAEQFIWGEPLQAGANIEPMVVAQSWLRAGPPHSIVERVLGLSNLAAGWDGYTGKSVDGQTVDRALGLLNDLYGRAASERVTFDAPVVGPTPGGSIQLEWNLPGAFLAVEIPRQSEPLSFYLEYADDRETGRDAASPEDVWNAVKMAIGV